MRVRAERRFPALVAAALFLAACAWAGAGLYRALRPGPRTVIAREALVSETLALEGIILRREQLIEGPGEISAPAGQRLAAGTLLGRTASGAQIRAGESALYYPDWDGYEGLGPELAEDLDAAGLEALLKGKPRRVKNALGRLVPGREWFYAALLREGDAPEPGRYRLLFEGQEEAVPASLLRAEDGLLIFRLSVQEGALERKPRARLILRELRGLELPTDALEQRDGEPGVELLQVSGPEWTPVSLIYRDEQRCLVAPASQDGGLVPGSSVLLREREELP